MENNIDKLIEDLVEDRRVVLIKSLVMDYLSRQYGYTELNDSQESLLNHVLYNEQDNFIILKSRKVGLSKLSEALLYAKKEALLYDKTEVNHLITFCKGYVINSRNIHGSSELIVSDLGWDFNWKDLKSINTYNKVTIFTPINSFLKEIVDGYVNIENGRNTQVLKYLTHDDYIRYSLNGYRR